MTLRIKRTIFLKPLFVLGVIVILWLGTAIIKEIARYKGVKTEAEKLEKEISLLEEKNRELSYEIESFKEEAIIEREARERLNLKKPGEKTVIIVSSEEASQDQSSQEGKSTLASNQASFFKNLWIKFINLLTKYIDLL